MSVIQLKPFGGMAPSVAPEYLTPEVAVFAKNIDVRYKDMSPFLAPVAVTTAASGSTLYKFSGSSAFITKTGDVDFVRGPIPNDTTERTYYTGDGAPKATDLTLAVRQLGVPSPSSAPTATKVEVLSFTKDESEAARIGAPTVLANAIKPVLEYVFYGMKDADLTDLVAHPVHPWEFDLVRAGSSVSGNFVPTLASDMSLAVAELEYFTDASSMSVPLFVRGGIWRANPAVLEPILAAIPTVDTTATGAMLDSTQVDNIIESVTNYLASRDKEMDAIIERIKADKVAFLELVNNPSSVTSILAGAVGGYYATPTGAAALDAAITSAANQIYNAAVAVDILTSITEISAKDTVLDYIVTGTEGYITLDASGLRDWIVANIRPSSWDEFYGEQRTYTAANSVISSLQTELQRLTTEASKVVTMGPSRYSPITQALVDLQAAMEYKVKEIGIISQSLVDKLDKFLVGVFETEVGGTFPLGTEPIIVSRAYVETYVTDWNEESKPSSVSNIVECDQNDNCSIELGAVPSGRNITKRRLYRSSSGSSSSAFLFQGEYTAATTTILDTKPADQLSEACPTFGWDEPLSNLKGLVGMPNGILLGFTGDTLHACEPYHPYAWPAKHDISIEYPIVGIAVAGQTAIVCTTGVPYLVSGVDSAGLSAEKLSANQSCVSKNSMVAIGGAVVYASPDGLVLVENGNATVITAAMLSKRDWSAYNPRSMFCAEYEGRYFAFYTKVDTTKGCLVFDFVTNSLVELDGSADAVFSDKSTDTIYALYSTSITNFMPTTGAALTAVYRSKLFRLPAHANFAWLHVAAEFGSVQVNIYTNGVLWHSRTVTTPEPVRIPAGRYREWQIEVVSSARVFSVTIASTSEELKQVI